MKQKRVIDMKKITEKETIKFIVVIYQSKQKKNDKFQVNIEYIHSFVYYNQKFLPFSLIMKSFQASSF